MASQFEKSCEDEMVKRMQHFEKDLAKVRTGRASANILDSVRVDYYGNPTPLNQVATISTPDARTVMVAPFAKNTLSDIERAIQMANIGIQPNNDGNVIRLPMPPLTEERRKDIAKTVKKAGEDAKVLIRQVRQDTNAKIKKAEKDKVVSEDDSKKIQDLVQKITDKHIKTVDEKVAAKEKEVLQL